MHFDSPSTPWNCTKLLKQSRLYQLSRPSFNILFLIFPTWANTKNWQAVWEREAVLGVGGSCIIGLQHAPHFTSCFKGVCGGTASDIHGCGSATAVTLTRSTQAASHSAHCIMHPGHTAQTVDTKQVDGWDAAGGECFILITRAVCMPQHAVSRRACTYSPIQKKKVSSKIKSLRAEGFPTSVPRHQLDKFKPP